MKKSSFRFLGYKVKKIELEIKEGFGTEKETISHKLEIINNFDKRNKRFVEVSLYIRIFSKNNNFKLLFEMKGGFIADEGVSDEVFKVLCQQNAPAILYPFARSIISNYTTLANIPPINLPIINFTNKSLIKKKKAVK